MCDHPENPLDGRHLNLSFSRRIGNCSWKAAVTNPSLSPSLLSGHIPSLPKPGLGAVGDGNVPQDPPSILHPARTWLLSLLCSALADKNLPISSPPSDAQLSWSYAKLVFLVSPGNTVKCHHQQLTRALGRGHSSGHPPWAQTCQGHQSICKWVALGALTQGSS